MNTYIEIPIVFLLAFLVCLGLTPLLIYFSKRKGLLDVPNQRASHETPTPTLGGLPIFVGLITVILFCIGLHDCGNIVVLILSLFVLLGTGILDDILSLKASLRLFIQLALGLAIASQGLRFTSMHGLLGIHELPIILQYVVTVFFIVAITNAFNLIDGIDGLAGGLGFINMLVMGFFFVTQNQRIDYVICFGMAGALLAFLFFNFKEARIFMGDTGSLILGFLTAYLCLKIFVSVDTGNLIPTGSSKITMIFGLVLVPTYDMLRVSIQRLLKRKSPFSADKTHIHHLLTRTGMKHTRAALSLYVVHVLVLLFSFAFTYEFEWQGILSGLTIVILAIEYPSLLQVKIFLTSLKPLLLKRQELGSENRFL
jgi:UDP-GlcNAc:undecaprenyl-phosphate GlcNAc-1-phosphate transferase